MEYELIIFKIAMILLYTVLTVGAIFVLRWAFGVKKMLANQQAILLVLNKISENQTKD